MEELLSAGKTPAMRQALAEKTGLSGDSILTWVNHADLFRINGVAGEFLSCWRRPGWDSVPELAQRVAANLQGRMTEVNAQKSLTARAQRRDARRLDQGGQDHAPHGRALEQH